MADKYAARLGDPIIHTSVLADIAAVAIQGIAVAAAGAIVAGVAIIAAPLAAASTVVGAVLAAAGGCVGAGLIAGFVLQATGMMDEVVSESEGLASAIFPPSPAGVIATGATNVMTNDIPAARAAGRLLSTTEQAGLTPEPEGERDYVAMLLNGGKAMLKEMINPTVDVPPGPVAPSNMDTVLCEKHPPNPPQYLAEGSSSVSINDLPAVRSDDRTTCGATVSTAASPNVTIGGAAVVVRPIKSGKVPGLDLILMAASLLLTRNPSKMFKKMPCMLMMIGAGMVSSQLAAATHSAMMPVHAATGAKVLGGEEDLDFVLPARFPLHWQRIYNSRNPVTGMFGKGWRTPFETWLVHEDEQVCFHDEGGRELRFASLAAGERKFYPDTGLIVAAGDEGQYLVADLDGSVWRLYLPDPLSPQNLRLSSLSDEYGNGVLLDCDEQGRLAGLSDTQDSLRVTLHYQIASQPRCITQITDDSCDTPRILMTYGYSPAGQLARVTDASGVTLREFDYTREGLMAWHLLPSGLRSDYGWQHFADDWRVIFHSTGAGRRTGMTYDLDQRITHVYESDGLRREHHWNADYLVERYIDEAGSVWCYEWDENQQLTKTVAPDGAMHQYVYDLCGNLVEEINPLGGVSKTVWLEQQALPRDFIDPQDGVYRLQYDACHGVIAEEDPLGNISRYERDELGQVTAFTNASGGISRFTWNERGQLTQAQDCSGQTTCYGYDKYYRQISVTDATGESRSFEYDAAGRIIQLTSAEGRQEQIFHDARGRLTGFRAADGTLREYGYDAVTGQLHFSRDALGGTVTRAYDHRGRLTGLCNENGETYRFNWGTNDRLTEEIGLDDVITRYDYDECNRTTRRIFAANSGHALTHQFTRDLSGQLIAKQTPDGVTAYQYSPAGHLTEAVFTPQNDGIAQQLRLDYDLAGQLTAEDGINGAVGYQYDALGNRTSVTLPDGRSLRTLYYGSGHALQIMLDSRLITEFSRDALHRETGRTQGALHSGLRYDRYGRVTERWTGQSPHSALAQTKESWHYDLRDNLTSVHQSTPLFRQRRYSYDAADRLIGRETGASTPQYLRYDPASNPLDPTLNIGAWPHNRVIQQGKYEYLYDIYGRTTEKRTHGERWLYRYDSEHRLTEVLHQPVSHTLPECVVSFAYDPLGRRISKRVRYQRMEGVTADAEKYRIKETRFLWEGPRLLAEFNGYRSQIYAYGDQNSFAPLARIDGGGDDSQIYYYHNQVNGQPEAMTDREGNECWRGESDSFGKVTGETRAQRIMSGGPQNLRMQGQYLDRETGLHYNLHRYYDPDSGRFTQADPIGLAGGLNLYQYAPNVLGWVDPWGLSCGTIKANSRNEALNRAQQHAQVPRISRGGQDISLNDLNPTSRGDNWGKMKADGAQKLGRRNPNGKNSRFEHPDGHPADAGKPDIPDHHSNGHVHAINTKGEEVIFTW